MRHSKEARILGEIRRNTLSKTPQAKTPSPAGVGACLLKTVYIFLGFTIIDNA
jgi:hypothetical protein